MGLLHDRGACERLGSGSRTSNAQLSAAITELCHDAARRTSLGERLGVTTDGQGAERVCEILAAMEGCR
jgi:hypothetical protein